MSGAAGGVEQLVDDRVQRRRRSRRGPRRSIARGGAETRHPTRNADRSAAGARRAWVASGSGSASAVTFAHRSRSWPRREIRGGGEQSGLRGGIRGGSRRRSPGPATGESLPARATARGCLEAQTNREPTSIAPWRLPESLRSSWRCGSRVMPTTKTALDRRSPRAERPGLAFIVAPTDSSAAAPPARARTPRARASADRDRPPHRAPTPAHLRARARSPSSPRPTPPSTSSRQPLEAGYETSALDTTRGV